MPEFILYFIVIAVGLMGVVGAAVLTRNRWRQHSQWQRKRGRFD